MFAFWVLLEKICQENNLSKIIALLEMKKTIPLELFVVCHKQIDIVIRFSYFSFFSANLYCSIKYVKELAIYTYI